MENEIVLSILIPTIPERLNKRIDLQVMLQRQIDFINETHPTLGKIEVLIDNDKKFIYGGKTVGQKRNDLVQRANGKYLCFLDDDDEVPFNYIETILRAALMSPDIITFNSLFKCDTYWTLIDMSIQNENEESTPERIVKRNAWHICPMKSEIVKKYSFPNKNNAEDWEWMKQVLTEIKTEIKLNTILHQYNHSNLISAVDEIEHINSLPL